MNLGEKIETILYRRTNGNFGLYLGSTAKTFGACKIDGVIYKVERNIETDDNPMWKVKNLTTGKVAIAQDEYDIGLIKPSDFN